MGKSAEKYTCWICGQEAETTAHMNRYVINGAVFFTPKSMSRKLRCYCEKCKIEYENQKKEDTAEYIRLKKQAMFENAMANIEKSGKVDMYNLRPAIDKTKLYLEKNPDKFDSSYEVIAVIMLIDAGCQIQLQAKVGRYQVDIMIPNRHLIVEIDGDRHAHRKEYDSQRDITIKEILGPEWDILRIKTEYLEQNPTKLVKAINYLREYKHTGKINWRKI